MTTSPEESRSKREMARSAVTTGGHWVGYGWFMSFGTVIPLLVFLGGYLVQVTLSRRSARPLDLPVRDLDGDARPGAARQGEDGGEADRRRSGKKPFFERVRPYSPPGWIEKRGKPISMPIRIVWFVLIGWWLGAVWVVISWSPFLLPYPLFDIVAQLLGEVPCVMTLAWPETVAPIRPAT